MKMRKILSLILACLMTVSVLAFTAFAAKEPLYVIRANQGNRTGFSAEAVTATLGHDTTNDIVYYHFVPKESSDWMHFAWHDAAGKFEWKTPMTMGIVMRTNKESAVPSIRFCDRDGKNVTITKKSSAIKGNGEWEIVWLPTVTADDVASAGFAGLTHIQGFAMGESIIGKDNLTSGLYFDIAGYAFFNDTLENVKSIDLKKTLGLGDNGKLTFDRTDDGKPSGSASVPTATPASPSAKDLVLDYTKMQRGICDHKDTGVVDIVDDSAVGKAVSFKINPNATMQDYITIDGYGADSFGIDLASYKYMHIEMKFTSSKLAEVKPVMRFLSTTGSNIQGMPYLTATPALKADGKWQTVSIDMSVLAGKYSGASIVKQVQFSVGGREHMAADFGAGDEICVSKIVLSNTPSFASSATGSGSTGTVNEGPKYDAPDKEIDYTKFQRGVCDHKDTGKVEVKDGVVTFVVNNQPDNNDHLTIDGYGAEIAGIDLIKHKYMTIEMKLESSTIEEVYPVMRFLSTIESGNINGAPYVRSAEPLPADGEWHKITIGMYNGVSASGILKSDVATVKHVQFSVGGREYKANNFGNGDKISVRKITLTNDNPNKNKDFTVSFMNGFSLAEGTAPADIVGKPGTKFTIPEVPFKAEGYDAIGWMQGSYSDKVIVPGTEMEIGEENMTFDVVWRERVEAKDFVSIDYASYFNGICDNSDSAKAEVISLNGKPVVKVVPNPAVTSKSEAINLDGWSYGGANLNLNLYKTIMIEYLYLSDNPVEGNAKFNIMAKNFSKSTYTVAREPIVEGRWAVATFDMTLAEPNMIATVEPKIMQAHIYPLGGNSTKLMSANDVLYVGKIIAIPEVTTSGVNHESFINGYADGTFGIAGNMTRAEACTIVARLMAAGDANVPTDKTTSFTDVDASQWYHKYISYVESLGFLKSYSGNFLPNQNITRAEFVELVYNMGLLQDAGKNGTFTDVPADHARAEVIAAAGKAGLVNGYDNGDGTFSFKPDATITRAEVVKVINNAYGKKPTADGIFEAAKNKFSDVPADHWAFADIIDASVSHISAIDADGKEIWKYVNDNVITSDGFVADLEAGAKALEEYTALFDKRAEEIKNTPNMDLSTITGKKYYVSSSTGNDANDGLTEATALKTITAATNKAVKGDAVLLKRGDMWRERVKARGVLYTAYGEGAKPIINSNVYGDAADESLWTLVDGTTNIWKYAKTIPDVGNIVVNGNKTIEKLASTVKINNSMMFVGGQALDPAIHLTKDNMFVSMYTSINGNSANLDTSELFVRCDAGNPGKVYDSIELCYRGHGVSAVSGMTFDNIALFYAGSHGVAHGSATNVKYTNMEIGWIGGSAQNANNGSITRFGNGIEVYGGCDNFVIDNCYVYQCYDAGITHQKQLGSTDDCVEKNVWFTNNVIDRCIYNIEYFMGKADKAGVTRLMENITYEGNLLARSGYGWGYGPTRSASIKGWDHHNNHAINFNIKNNVFIMDRVNAIDCGYGNVAWMPVLSGNTYIQKLGNTLTKMGANGATQYLMDSTSAYCLEKVLGEEGAVLYYVDKNVVVEEIK
ncbi:MAG: S-layer homology domain-containing protein [Clostridia bacterium]|nr:S-layer homology domain-containing protein [Clostridia bacterium]